MRRVSLCSGLRDGAHASPRPPPSRPRAVLDGVALCLARHTAYDAELFFYIIQGLLQESAAWLLDYFRWLMIAIRFRRGDGKKIRDAPRFPAKLDFCRARTPGAWGLVACDTDGFAPLSLLSSERNKADMAPFIASCLPRRLHRLIFMRRGFRWLSFRCLFQHFSCLVWSPDVMRAIRRRRRPNAQRHAARRAVFDLLFFLTRLARLMRFSAMAR